MNQEHKRIENISKSALPYIKQFPIRSDLHVGATPGCSQGLQYWKSEYQRLKQTAKSLGCI